MNIDRNYTEKPKNDSTQIPNEILANAANIGLRQADIEKAIQTMNPTLIINMINEIEEEDPIIEDYSYSIENFHTEFIKYVLKSLKDSTEIEIKLSNALRGVVASRVLKNQTWSELGDRLSDYLNKHEDEILARLVNKDSTILSDYIPEQDIRKLVEEFLERTDLMVKGLTYIILLRGMKSGRPLGVQMDYSKLSQLPIHGTIDGRARMTLQKKTAAEKQTQKYHDLRIYIKSCSSVESISSLNKFWTEYTNLMSMIEPRTEVAFQKTDVDQAFKTMLEKNPELDTNFFRYFEAVTNKNIVSCLKIVKSLLNELLESMGGMKLTRSLDEIVQDIETFIRYIEAEHENLKIKYADTSIKTDYTILGVGDFNTQMLKESLEKILAFVSDMGLSGIENGSIESVSDRLRIREDEEQTDNRGNILEGQRKS